MFEQTFKNLDDVLWKEAGCSSELDYTEQISWLLFLKYLDDLRFRSQKEKHELSSDIGLFVVLQAVAEDLENGEMKLFCEGAVFFIPVHSPFFRFRMNAGLQTWASGN